MKYALVNEKRQEAQPGLSGKCQRCSDSTIAKCGEIKIWHWAHRGELICDSWKENETEWHRNWKGHFPNDWQEKVHIAGSGEKHIADVKTIKDWVIEFQHSHIKPEERRARGEFYEKLVWVVDGMRRKRDKQKFFDSLKEVTQANNSQSPVRRIFKVLWDDCPLFRDWSCNPAPVFFDFGKEDTMLWCLLPQNSDGEAFVLEFFREGFIMFHRNELIEKDFFADLMKNFTDALCRPPPRIQSQARFVLQPRYRRSRRF